MGSDMVVFFDPAIDCGLGLAGGLEPVGVQDFVAFSEKTASEARNILDDVRKSILSTTLCKQQLKLYLSCSAAITYERFTPNDALGAQDSMA